jgi:hypothetical protein
MHSATWLGKRRPGRRQGRGEGKGSEVKGDEVTELKEFLACAHEEWGHKMTMEAWDKLLAYRLEKARIHADKEFKLASLG